MNSPSPVSGATVTPNRIKPFSTTSDPAPVAGRAPGICTPASCCSSGLSMAAGTSVSPGPVISTPACCCSSGAPVAAVLLAALTVARLTLLALGAPVAAVLLAALIVAPLTLPALGAPVAAVLPALALAVGPLALPALGAPVAAVLLFGCTVGP